MSPLSEIQYQQIQFYMSVLITTPTAMFGVGANMVNMVIFLKQGVRDCVSVCLLALTVSDFGTVVFGGATAVFNVLMYLDVRSIIRPFAFIFIMSYYCILFYDISQAVMAFVALERCLCVIWPLRFKDIFTFRRSVLVVILVYALTASAYMPHFLTSGLVWAADQETNTSRVDLWVAGNRPEVHFYLNTFLHIVMATLLLVSVLVSTHVMVSGLKRSSKFRERKAKSDVQVQETTSSQHGYHLDRDRSSTDPKNSQIKDNKENDDDANTTNTQAETYRINDRNEDIKATNGAKNQCIVEPKTDDGLHSSSEITQKTGSGITSKNRRVIKTVTALALISLTCNSVRLGSAYAQRLVIGLSYGGRYHQEYTLMNKAVFVFQTVNASANVLVYYNLNASFRNTFKSLFCRQ